MLTIWLNSPQQKEHDGTYLIWLSAEWKFRFNSKRKLEAFRGSTQKWYLNKVVSVNYAFSLLDSLVRKNAIFFDSRDLRDIQRFRAAYDDNYMYLVVKNLEKPVYLENQDRNFHCTKKITNLHSVTIQLANYVYELATKRNITVLKYEISCLRETVQSCIYSYKSFTEIQREFDLPNCHEIDLPLLKVV